MSKGLRMPFGTYPRSLRSGAEIMKKPEKGTVYFAY